MSENSLWVEKYRPSTIDQIVMTQETKDFFTRCIKDNTIPPLLLSGPPGSGKTTTARILYDSIIKDDADGLILNGSDHTGVDSVRNIITGFLKSPPFASKIKIVFIDEADFLSPNAQGALRHIIEEYYDSSRMIFTCNYLSKIIDPLVSRFQHFRFERLNEEFITDYCEDILKKETITYKKESVSIIVKSLTPDVRKIVNTIQRHILNNELKGVDASTISTIEKKLLGLIIEICNHIGKADENSVTNKNMTQIQTILNSDIEPDYRFVYSELFSADIPAWAKIKLNRYSNGHQSCAIPSIHFQAMVLDMLMAGKEYFQTFVVKK